MPFFFGIAPFSSPPKGSPKMIDFLISVLLINTVALFGFPALATAVPGQPLAILGVTAVILEPVLVVWLYLLRRSAKMYQKGLEERFNQRKRAQYYERVAVYPAATLTNFPNPVYARGPVLLPNPPLSLPPIPTPRFKLLPGGASATFRSLGTLVRYGGKTYENRGGGAWYCLEDQEFFQSDGTSYREVAGM